MSIRDTADRMYETLVSPFIISQAQVIPEDRESAVIITGGTHPPSDTPMPQ